MTNTSEDNNNYQIKLAIRVIIGRDKAAPDSFELFKAFANLARTSKAYNNLLDELLITLSCRCIQGGGCRFARNKLYSYIRTSNADKFISCANQILQTYHSSVYNPIFTKCLIDIVKNSTYDFLASYINFLKSRSIIMPCQQFFYLRDKPRSTPYGKYPGFKPRDLVNALRISNEKGWTDKALLLFEHLVEYYTGEVPAYLRDRTEEIRAEISKNNKLNFDGQLANELHQAWRNANPSYHLPVLVPSRAYLSTLIAPKRMEVAKVPKETFKLPIYLQPWFVGHVESPIGMLLDSSADESFIVTFRGTRLIRWEKNTGGLIYSPTNLPRFYLPAKDGCPKYVYLYHFYCSLQNQDLDAMKSIQETHNIKWSEVVETLKQPNPILEHLKSTSTNNELIRYMIDIGVPTNLNPWEANREVRDDQLTAINMLLSAGAKIPTELVIVLLKKKPFMDVLQFQRLIEAWDQRQWRQESRKIIEFLIHNYRTIYKGNKIINERILTVLWIHKFGKSDTCNYLQTLPKELIKVIIEFLNEAPLFYQLASLVMKIPGATAQCRVADFYRSPLIGQLVLEAEDDEVISRGIYIFNPVSYKVLRENYYWIRRAICERPKLVIKFQNGRKLKLLKHMMKSETDITIFRHLHRHQLPEEKWPFIDAFKTKNISALRYFIEERNNFEMPSRAEFEAQMKRPKYTITYEQALALIEQIKAKK